MEPDVPDPLTPPDCNLTDFPFMPLEVARLRRSKSWLAVKRNPAIAFYLVNLWAASWHEVPAASLDDDDDILADRAMCDPRQWAKVRSTVLAAGWVKCSDGRLYHPVVAEKARDAWAAKRRRQAKMMRHIHILSGEWDTLRSAVFARDDYTCTYCGARGGKLECDHIVPVALGGRHTPENLTTACRPCNRAKGAKLLGEWQH